MNYTGLTSGHGFFNMQTRKSSKSCLKRKEINNNKKNT